VSRRLLTIHYELNENSEKDSKILSIISYWSPKERGKLFKSLIHDELFESMFGAKSNETLLKILSALKQEGLDNKEPDNVSVECSHPKKEKKKIPKHVDVDEHKNGPVNNAVKDDDEVSSIGVNALKDFLIGGNDNE